ncbi:MAG: hypothetical protein ACYCXW_10510 [Solirubrobacteraceae bacterium]
MAALLAATAIGLGAATAPAQASSWTSATIDASAIPTGISCPTSGFCAVTDGAGDVLTSSDPAGGASAWSSPVQIDSAASSGQQLNGISCPSSSFCAATDSAGNVLTSQDPAGGAAAWATADADSTAPLYGISCPSTTLCVAVDSYGEATISTDPTDGAHATWNTVSLEPQQADIAVNAISCPSASLCVAVDGNGDVLSTQNPSAGSNSTWALATVDQSNTLNGISCPTTSLCVAVDGAGQVFVSTDPTGGASAWTPATIDASADNSLAGVSCASGTLCVTVDGAGYAIASSDPGGGAAKWSGSQVANLQPLLAVSCAPTTTWCAAVDTNGDVLTSENPLSSSGGSVSSPGGNSGAGSTGGTSGSGGATLSVGHVHSGVSVSVAVACAGVTGTICQVAVSLATTVRRRPSTRRITVALGRTSTAVNAGQTQTVTVFVNARGRRLLKQLHRLSVKLTVAEGGHKTNRTVRLTS